MEIKGKIMILNEVRGDSPFQDVVAPPGIYQAHINPHGAVSVETEKGELLGVKPNEFKWLNKE
jgi:hypothetical protein